MTLYEAIIQVENMTGIASGRINLTDAMNYLEEIDAPHTKDCPSCVGGGSEGTLYHSFLLTQDSYAYLTTNMEFNWTDKETSNTNQPEWVEDTEIYLSEV